MADEWDAVVVGAGPNGLTAAATLGRAGWKVLVVEAEPHHRWRQPVGAADPSPASCTIAAPRSIPWPWRRPPWPGWTSKATGSSWVHPEVQVAHPLDGGRAGLVERSVIHTAAGLGPDRAAYERLMGPLVAAVDPLVGAVLSPLSPPPPRALPALARFAAAGAWPAVRLARSRFSGDEARGLMAGLSAHSMLSLRAPATSGYGLFLGMLAHAVGWPVARGGSQAIADALAAIIVGSGGEILVDRAVRRLDELPPARATLLDVSPRQLVGLGGDRLPARYRRALSRYRYGSGVWKLDWALDAPIPWTAEGARRAATVHVGGPLEQVAAAEAEVVAGRHPQRPFVLVVQPTIIDPSRAPAGAHVAWAYCHVPNGSTVDMTERIEDQIERFAPGLPGLRARAPHHGPGRPRAPRRQLRRRRHRRGPNRPHPAADPPGRVPPPVAHAGARSVPVLVGDPARTGRPWHVRVARGPGRPGRPADRSVGALRGDRRR